MGEPIYRIVFMGTPEFAVPSLKALFDGPDEVIAAVTQPDRPRGRGKKMLPSPVKVIAHEAGIPVFQPEKARSAAFIDEIKTLAPDLLVVVAYGQILPKALLDVPRVMPINVHGSLLPGYRGAAPIQWAILNGEKETGISIMQMDTGMDTGPALLKESTPIGAGETFESLSERLSVIGARLLVKAIEMLKNKRLTPVPQSDEGVSYAPPITPKMAEIDWTRPATYIDRLIRAFDPRPGAYTFWEGERLKLFSPTVIPACEDARPGTVISTDGNGILITTGDGCLLIRELFLQGKKRLPAAEFLRGHPILKGTLFKA